MYVLIHRKSNPDERYPVRDPIASKRVGIVFAGEPPVATHNDPCHSHNREPLLFKRSIRHTDRRRFIVPSNTKFSSRNLTLVTGGAGFIGSHIVSELVRRGENVRILDNFSTGDASNLDEVANMIEVIEGDLRESVDVEKAVHGATHVLHLGALGSVPRSLDDPRTTHDCNATGTLNVLRASQEEGVKRVVFASSSSVYGDTEVLPKVETMMPNPRSPYAASKLAGEGYCQAFHAMAEIETVVLRYFNVFGPRQSPDSPYAAVIAAFTSTMLVGDQPTIYGDGLQSRDFTYVSNVVHGTLLARDAKSAAGGIFNLACSGSFTINELVDTLNRHIGSNLAPRYTSPRAGDVRHSYADISAAGNWGYEPIVDFETGIAATVKHFNEIASAEAG